MRVKLKHIVLSLWFVWVNLVQAHAQETDPIAKPTPTPLEIFETKVDQAAEKDDFVGLALAVVKDGEIVLIKTYGTVEVNKSEPVTERTSFRIASLSKGFAATLAGLLVEEGKLDWSTKVAPIVPTFHLKKPQQTNKVVVRDILSHRVGLPPYAYDNLLEANKLPSEILGRYQEVDMTCDVSTCYAYQNVAFNMIADVIEYADGRPYTQSMRSRIFKPLGMNASLGDEALLAAESWARPHVRGRNKKLRVTRTSMGYYRVPAAGGVNANIIDMAIWLDAQMGGAPEVLSPELLDNLHAPAVETETETYRSKTLRRRLRSSSYGLGWRIYDYSGHTVINHSGSVRGTMAQIAFLPDQNIGIVILANSYARRTWRILPTFLDTQLGIKERDWLLLKTKKTG